MELLKSFEPRAKRNPSRESEPCWRRNPSRESEPK
jgi:hypothetical protein